MANGVERKFIAAGLVDVYSIDNSIKVDLVNSDPRKNFFEADFYSGLNKAYLRRSIAIMLSKAQGTGFERYVANPEKGSMHNYGIAVDITIIDEWGDQLDMGPSLFYAI